MSHKVQLVELHGTRRGDKTLQHVPATESKVEPIRDNDQNSLCSCTGKNKMATISSGARGAALDWTDLDRKRKLLVILMMEIDDAFLVFCLLAFSFSSPRFIP